MVNLAEQVHRVRRRRDYLRDGRPQPGSLLDTVHELREAGIDADHARSVVARLCLEPVFTAHPTEATRRTLLRKEQRITRRLVERLDPSRTPSEERSVLERIRAEVTAGWQTEEHPSARPTVGDELEHVLFYLTDLLYRIVPPFYEALEDALTAVYGDGSAEPLPTNVLCFASWVGGDMDGNPNVTAATLRETLERHRELALGLYLRELDDLYQKLSQSPGRATFADELLELVRADPSYHEVRDGMPPRHREMPYRLLLTPDVPAPRAHPGGGRERRLPGRRGAPRDLRLLASSLESHRGSHAGLFAVRRAIRRVETFGFHLATLDVRHDAEVHRRAVARLLTDPTWGQRPAAERAAQLRLALSGAIPFDGSPDTETETTLEVVRAIADCRRRYGRRAIGPYIISMARGVDDVLSVLLLARRADLVDRDGRVPLDVAPLFETVGDLETAHGVMATLFADPAYRAHLAARGGRQTVMVGYSAATRMGPGGFTLGPGARPAGAGRDPRSGQPQRRSL